MSFVQYLNDYRLEVAAKLLTTTSDDIINIAINTGFDNLSYFNRCFKKKYGITPGKYRNPIIISKLKRQNIKKIVERETTSINCRQQYNNVVLRLSLKFNNNNKKNKTVPKTNVIDPTNNSTENKSPNDIL